MPKIPLGVYGERLVDDQRLEKVFYGLQRLVDFPKETEFTTQLVEPIADQGAQAAFYVTSPHPSPNKRAKIPPKVVTVAAMPYERWKMHEKEYRHYAFLADPLRPIFAGLLRRHLDKLENLKGLE